MPQIMSSTFEPSPDSQPEFFKLDCIDQKVAAWVCKEEPGSFFLFLQYAASQYRERGIELSPARLYNELVHVNEAHAPGNVHDKVVRQE